MLFIHQPFSPRRLGDYILQNLADERWTLFRAAIAFVKRSGTQHIRQPLLHFDSRASVRISAGIDFSTSKEGLADLLAATPNGEVWVYHNPGNTTFHPKTYLFRNDHQAELLVGSGNLTSGGLFKNYEASLALSLDLSKQTDLDLLNSVEAVLNGWSQASPGLCRLLTPQLLQQLVGQGYVRTEAQIAASAIHQPPGTGAGAGTGTQGGAGQQGQGRAALAPLFVATAVPPPPVVTIEEEPAAAVEVPAAKVASPTAAPAPVAAPAAGAAVTSFVMTLQNTDVGKGQTTRGTSKRSPEVFIPLGALDQNPTFWTFPNSFAPDKVWNRRNSRYRRNGLGKMDRYNVPIRIGMVQRVSMFFNPRKKDFRLRHEAIRSAGSIGDILWVQKVDPANGFEYDVQVAPQGTRLFNQLQSYCTAHVVNSQKRFGYF